MWAKSLQILAAAAFVLYPVAIYLGVRGGRIGLWLTIATLCLAPALVLRIYRARQQVTSAERPRVPALVFLPVLTLGLLGVSAMLQTKGLALATPTVVNAVLLVSFGATLRSDTPMVEGFARLIDPVLSAEQRQWCRLWTWIWCGFFLVNGLVAGALALWAPVLWWSFYTSLLAYIVMGFLFATERVGRWYKFQRVV